MKILRTPDDRFGNLPDFPYAPHYTDVPSGDGQNLRIHHLDEGPADGDLILCMHGQPTWSYLYRHMIPQLVAAGHRVVAPDLVGYGRSDKPADLEDYTYQAQVDWLNAWLQTNDFRNATLVGQDWGGLIGLRMVAENPDRFTRVVVANSGLPLPLELSEERIAAMREKRLNMPTPTIEVMAAKLMNPDPAAPEQSFVYWQRFCWDNEDAPIGMLVAGNLDGRQLSMEEIAAYDAPFPDPSYKMATRAMPSQVPTLPDDPSVEANKKAWEVFTKWEKPVMCAFSDNDPVSAGGDKRIVQRIPGAKGQIHDRISGGGHFLQEGRADELAARINQFIAANPISG